MDEKGTVNTILDFLGYSIVVKARLIYFVPVDGPHMLRSQHEAGYLHRLRVLEDVVDPCLQELRLNTLSIQDLGLIT